MTTNHLFLLITIEQDDSSAVDPRFSCLFIYLFTITPNCFRSALVTVEQVDTSVVDPRLEGECPRKFKKGGRIIAALCRRPTCGPRFREGFRVLKGLGFRVKGSEVRV